MKKSVLFFLLVTLIMSCEKSDNYLFPDGHYQGYFSYKNIDYWSSINLENGKYEEWPSGGARFQKEISTLTTGTYSIKGHILIFGLGAFKFNPSTILPLDPETWILPGNYELINSGKQDSLIFARGTGDNRIIYHLKKWQPNL